MNTLKRDIKTLVASYGVWLFLAMLCAGLLGACASPMADSRVQTSAVTYAETPGGAMPPPPAPAEMAMSDQERGTDGDVSQDWNSFDDKTLDPSLLASPKADTDRQATEGGSAEQGASSNAQPSQTERILVYTAQVQMAVFQVQESIDKVLKIAQDAGGYMSERHEDELVVRVPAAKFDEVMEKVLEMGNVMSRHVRVQDVTEEYLDLMLRLKNARVMRDRMAQLLEAAKTVEETLKVEKELNRISTEVERLEGRLKWLRNQVAYSTITIDFSAQRPTETSPAFQFPFPWMQQLGLTRLMTLY